MENRLYIFIIAILLNSCINKSTTVSTQYKENLVVEFTNISTLNYVMDSYYLKNGSLPNSKEDIQNEFGRDTINSLFQNPLIKGNELKYVPIYDNNNNISPIAYYIIGSTKNLKKIKKEVLIDKLISVCDYYNGKQGDIIFSYRNTYLITKENLSYNLEYAKSNYLKERKFYNVFFLTNKSLKILDSLSFYIKVDSIKIIGTFYNQDVKKSVQELNMTDNYITLEGLKTTNIEGGINLNNVFIKSPLETVKGKYYNEVGKLKTTPSLKNCY